MGSGRWTSRSFAEYNSSRGRKVDSDGKIAGSYSNQEIFLSRKLDPALDPKNVIRECCDSEEHPETFPVILALDVTGSMGQAAVEVAKQLNVIMTQLYDKVRDVEFMVMGIGDFECDLFPLQISQFESDIRIADQLERIYFEFGGGGNNYESYTAAWYMAARHTRLDAWKRGKKGILITMGDEPLNPYLPRIGMRNGLAAAGGGRLDFPLIFDVYHLNVIHRSYEKPGIEKSFRKYLDQNHFMTVNMDSIAGTITEIITNSAGESKKTWNPIDRVKTMIAW